MTLHSWLFFGLLVLSSCDVARKTKQLPPPPALLLSLHPESLVRLELPESNRPGGTAAPSELPIEGPWEVVNLADGVIEYQAALPFDQVFLGESTDSAPAGLKFLDKNRREVPYQRNLSAKDRSRCSWRLDGLTITLRVPEDQLPPSTLSAKYPPGSMWLNGLDRAHSTADDHEYALRRTGLVHDDREGVLLPAPGTAVWRVAIPAGAALSLEAKILPSSVLDGHSSDGATLEMLVTEGGIERFLDRLILEPGADWAHWKVDLARYADQDVDLVLRTTPGEGNDLDYVFLAEPTIHVPRATPHRVVLIFVDTLRRDHVGLYGYQNHPTTPELDAWAEGAVVFDNAHTYSPWTLPSVQALLLGREPHSWSTKHALPEVLRQEGFVTAFLCANPYLKPAFGMADGWSRYHFEFMATAEHQVDAAIDLLDRSQERDLALMVQFMDPHLPYREPMPFRGLWAGSRPSALPGLVTRDRLVELEADEEQLAKIKPWVIERYDQNIRYVDAQIGRLLQHLDDDDIVVFFSDHGEEFWDHGGVEHGHTVYEELLAVPLVIKAPGLEPGRVDEPVSLMDVAPTITDLLGASLPGSRGVSLVAVAGGSTDQRESLSKRPVAFGQTLYGDEAWGVYEGDSKWFVWGSQEHAYDLATDPIEQKNLVADGSTADRSLPALEQALGCPVFPVWRVAGHGLRKSTKQGRGSVTLSHPEGFTAAWAAPGIRVETATPTVVDGEVVVTAGGGKRIPREFYAIGPSTEHSPVGMSLVVDTGTRIFRNTTGGDGDESALDGDIIEAGKASHHYTLMAGIAPRCEESAEVEVDEQTLEQLRELGYIE